MCRRTALLPYDSPTEPYMEEVAQAGGVLVAQEVLVAQKGMQGIGEDGGHEHVVGLAWAHLFSK